MLYSFISNLRFMWWTLIPYWFVELMLYLSTALLPGSCLRSTPPWCAAMTGRARPTSVCPWTTTSYSGGSSRMTVGGSDPSVTPPPPAPAAPPNPSAATPARLSRSHRAGSWGQCSAVSADTSRTLGPWCDATSACQPAWLKAHRSDHHGNRRNHRAHCFASTGTSQARSLKTASTKTPSWTHRVRASPQLPALTHRTMALNVQGRTSYLRMKLQKI